MSDNPRPSVVRRIALPIQEFIQTEVASGAVLFAAALIALIWANSQFDEEYFEFFAKHITIETPVFRIDESLKHWINDGLMALFFFVVGLEIKREFLRGELQGFRRAALPAVAALGGMVVPALIFTAFNAGGDGARGWGIPMATDIAFALGILALAGSRVPPQLRVFLLALAIVDDVGAIVVIALFYSGDVQLDSLLISVALVVLILVFTLTPAFNLPVFLIAGLCLWVAVYESGIHATIAGVVLGLLTPLDGRDPDRTGPLGRLEHGLHPYTSFVVVPLFALANAGVVLGAGTVRDALETPVTLGVALGLVLGKPLGIVAFAWIAVRFGLAHLPRDTRWPQMAAVGVLAGVGFTVALFVNELAFDSAARIEEGKIGILLASLVAGIAGFVLLRVVSRGAYDQPISDGETGLPSK